MLGGHIWELAIILGLALIVFGPKRLPEIGGALGKGIREFKQGTSELTNLGASSSPESEKVAVVSQPIAVPVQPHTTHASTYEAEDTPTSAPYSHAG